MGKIYKIPARESFLDNLALGLINNSLYNQDLQETLIILPTKLSGKLLYDSLLKYSYKNLILPKIIPLADLSNNDDPFKYLDDFLALPQYFSILEIKIYIWQIYDSWNSDTIYNKKQFCNDALKFFIELEELECDLEEIIINLDINQYEEYDKSLMDFFRFFIPKWLDYSKKEHKISFIQYRNLLVKLREKNLHKINSYKNIILAGTTGTNKCTKNLIKKIITAEKGVFVFHEAINLDHHKENYYPNYSYLKEQEQSVNFWYINNQEKKITTNIQLINNNDIYQEARLITNIIKNNKAQKTHTNIITNNLELRNLIINQIDDIKIAKQNYYLTDPLNLALFTYLHIIKYLEFIVEHNNAEPLLENQLNYNHNEKIINFLKIYYPETQWLKISEFIKNIHDKNIKLKYKISNIYELEKDNIFSFITEILDKKIAKILDKITYIKKSFPNNIKQIIEILNYLISRNNHNIYYHNQFITFLASKDARLKHHQNSIIADIGETSWQANILNIFNNQHLIKLLDINLITLRKQQIAHDFLIHKYNPNLILTKSSFINNKQNVNFFYIKSFTINNNYYYDDLKNIPITILSQKKAHIFCPQKYKTHNFSVTQIEKLLQNPYAIYAKKILELKALSLFKFESEQKFFGILIHKIIDIYIKNYKEINSPIKYLTKLYNNEIKQFHWKKSLQYSWKKRFSYIARWFIAQHQNSIDNKAQINSEYQVRSKINNIFLTAKIDRLEHYDKELKIIDYKTGIPAKRNHIIEGLSTQLALEAYICLSLDQNNYNKKINLEYWQLQGKENQLGKIHHIKETEHIIEIAKNNIGKIISTYQNPQTAIIAFPNENNLPKYDDYYHLTRYQR